MKSTLLIDIGNSRIKWFFDTPQTPLSVYSKPKALSHHEENWIEQLRSQWLGQTIIGCCISNVAHANVFNAVCALIGSFFPNVAIQVIAVKKQNGALKLAYDPSQMGTDRYAQLLGAQSICAGKSHVVISAGTATTMDGVLSNGQHVGGIILPSVQLMRQSLHQYTARLPLSGGQFQRQRAPKNSQDALATGVQLAIWGALNEFVTRYMPDLKPRWILCGGDAEKIATQLSQHQPLIVPALCLLGLNVMEIESHSQHRNSQSIIQAMNQNGSE